MVLHDSRFLFVDKLQGSTSFDVVRKVRKAIGGLRVGHAGTLDPLATGLLILGISSATKRMAVMADLPKEYDFTIRFGLSTATDDIEGETLSTKPADLLREADVRALLPEFTGKLSQRPPDFSAVHVNGKRAYQLARSGKEVRLKEKLVVVHEIELLQVELPLVRLRVLCSKGTYMRSLARDMGVRIGTGGCVSRIRRTRIGPFTADSALAEGDITPESVRAHWVPENHVMAALARNRESPAREAGQLKGFRP